MEINVKVCVELSETTQKFLAGIIAGAVSNQPVQTTQTALPEQPVKKAAPKKEAAKAVAETAPAKVEQTKDEEEAPVKETTGPVDTGTSTGPVQTAEAATELTYNDLKLIMQKKIGEGKRDGVKESLNSLGAPSLTALPKEKYGEFKELLEAL